MTSDPAMAQQKKNRRLARAAVGSFERIARDRERVGPELHAAFDHLLEQLFEPSLGVESLAASVGRSRYWLSRRFQAALGQTPSDYLTARRLETARELLGEAAFAIWEIAALVGYRSAHAFSRAFSRWAGLSPAAFREQLRVAAGRPRRAEELRWWRHMWFRLHLGLLEREEAQLFYDRLQEIYGEEPGTPRVKSPTKERAKLERRGLEILWPQLRRSPREEVPGLSRRGYRFRTPAIFYGLLRESRVKRRQDPAQAIEVAELALRCLEPLRGDLGDEEVDRLRPEGLVTLAEARRCAGELSAAGRSYAEARELYAALGEERRAASLALEVALLRLEEGHPEEARRLAAEALPAMRSLALDAAGREALERLEAALEGGRLGGPLGALRSWLDARESREVS